MVVQDVLDTVGEAMTVGRELDAMIAEKVMGWTNDDYGWLDDNGLIRGWAIAEGEPPLPNFSTQIAAAWLVIEKMKHFTLRRKGESWTVEYRDCGNPMDHFVVDDCCASVTADTAPLAICLAAIKAVGVDHA